jgi:hypothetical protein
MLLQQHDQVKEDVMGWAHSTNWENNDSHRILVGEPEGKRPLRRPRRWWVNSIKMAQDWLEWYGLDLSAQNLDQ